MNSCLNNLPILSQTDKIIQRCRDKNLYFSIEVEKDIRSRYGFHIVNTLTKKGIAGQASDTKWVERCCKIR